MHGLCRYRNLLGEPGKGIHSLRLGGFAVADILLTAGLSLLASKALNASFVLVFLILVVIAIGLHEAFCVNTRLNALVFRRPWPTPGAQV